MSDKPTLGEVMAFDAGQADAKTTIDKLKAELAIKDKALELAVRWIYKTSRQCPATTIVGVKCGHYDTTEECQVGTKDWQCWQDYFINKAKKPSK